MWVFDPSVLVRTMSWERARRLAVDGGRSTDEGNVLEEAPDTHEKASTGVDEVRDHTDQVGHGKVASDVWWVEIDAADGEVGSGIGMARGNYRKMEVVDMGHTEQEAVAWDDDHERWNVMVAHSSIH